MFPTTTTTTTSFHSRKSSQRRFSVDLLIGALPTVLAPKRPRSASLPTPHCPMAVPRKSALKRPRALSEGDMDSSSSTFPSTVLAEDDKQAISDEVKLALLLEARLARDSTLDNVLDSVSARVPRTISKLFKRTPSRAYWRSHDEFRASAVRRNWTLPPPAEWNEVSVIFQTEGEDDSESDSDSEDGVAPTPPSTPRTVRFRVPAPPAPEPEPQYEEPAWSDFMTIRAEVQDILPPNFAHAWFSQPNASRHVIAPRVASPCFLPPSVRRPALPATDTVFHLDSTGPIPAIDSLFLPNVHNDSVGLKCQD
ncbi:hypothetical protein DFH06DRAFT_1388022 [Mycena polygramma]|nr:hypothetical protein DFH06DRAFT_1388022 [Mycena polygramma]